MEEKLNELNLIEKEETVKKLKEFKENEEMFEEIEPLADGFQMAIDYIESDFNEVGTKAAFIMNVLEKIFEQEENGK